MCDFQSLVAHRIMTALWFSGCALDARTVANGLRNVDVAVVSECLHEFHGNGVVRKVTKEVNDYYVLTLNGALVAKKLVNHFGRSTPEYLDIQELIALAIGHHADTARES